MGHAGNVADVDNFEQPPITDHVHSSLYDEKTVKQVSECSAGSIKSHEREEEPHEEEEQLDVEPTSGDHVTRQKDQLEPVVSKQPSVNHVESIPNGGAMAWLQVLGGFFLFFNSW